MGSAGSAKFHAFHGHFHYQNVFNFRLLSVDESWKAGTPPEPTLIEGTGRKISFEPTTELMTDWYRFYQDARDCLGTGWFEMQAGWGDLYEWNRGGNYIEFPETSEGSGVPLEGYYVLQGQTDPGSLIVESNETDNVSYAFIEVDRSGKVELIERGYGTHPWDPNKVVLTVSP